MSKTLLFTLTTLLIALYSHAQLLCPPDVTIQCTDSPTDLQTTGMPTVYNASGQLRYIDQRTHAQCHAGSIERTWFLDTNSNSRWDSGEHRCIQNISIQYIPGTVTVTFPPDREYTCTEAIETENPTWESTGPCDIIGISKHDMIFEADGQSCYKILRKWTVLNWCIYTPGGTEGIWTHTQLIKVVDESAPRIQNCQPVTLGTDKGCEGTFSITNSATDNSPCGQQTLLWRAEIDLWADGTLDYQFSHNHSDSLFRLAPVASGVPVTVTLPWPVRRGMHKVHWYVLDLCGNTTSCTQTVFLLDNKKPTPYIHALVSTSFDAKQMDLMLSASMFNVGSFDNCTPARHLRYSFSSNVNDTIRTIDCNTAGFNFFTIFVTDMEGNQAEADVIVLAFDNGSCGNRASLKGIVLESDGQPVKNAQFKMSVNGDSQNIVMATSSHDGSFTFENTGIYSKNTIKPMQTILHQRTVDVADLRLLQDYLTGLTSLESFQFVAGDIDQDGRLKSRDLFSLRDRILLPERYRDINPWLYIYDTQSLSGQQILDNIKQEVALKDVIGPLHFRAVHIGDITDALVKSSEPRTQNFWLLNQNGFTYDFVPQNDVQIQGLQLEIQLPETWSEIVSPYFDIPSSSAHIDENNVLRVVLTRDMALNAQVPALSISAQGEQQPKLSLSDNSKILLNEYRTQNISFLEEKKSSFGPNLAPNPTDHNFFILNAGTRILKIYDSIGNDVSFQQSDREVMWDVLPGIYFIELKWADGHTFTEKIIKK